MAVVPVTIFLFLLTICSIQFSEYWPEDQSSLEERLNSLNFRIKNVWFDLWFKSKLITLHWPDTKKAHTYTHQRLTMFTREWQMFSILKGKTRQQLFKFSKLLIVSMNWPCNKWMKFREMGLSFGRFSDGTWLNWFDSKWERNLLMHEARTHYKYMIFRRLNQLTNATTA